MTAYNKERERLKSRIRQLKHFKKTHTRPVRTGGFSAEQIFLDETIRNLHKALERIDALAALAEVSE